MKRTLFNIGSVQTVAFLVVTLVGLAKGSATAGTPLGKSLVELESHIKWEAVDSDWKGMRESWVEKTTGCADAACVAQQMATLEEHVKWEAVDPAWKKRRDAWVEECKNAKSDAQVSTLMLEFEQNVGWKAVDEKWKDGRDAWIAGLKKG
jgi:hypothetical protein